MRLLKGNRLNCKERIRRGWKIRQGEYLQKNHSEKGAFSITEGRIRN